MKKYISLILTVLMIVITAAGCAGKDKSNDSTSKAESTAGKDATSAVKENDTTAGDVETADKETKGEETTEGSSGDVIKITESFSVSDPEGLTYETRHVYTGNKDCMMIQGMVLQGYKASEVYIILYENEKKAVGEYQVIVCDDKDSADKLKAFYSTAGQNLTQEENVLYMFSPADVIQSTIAMYAGIGAFSSETPEAYLEYLANTNGLTKQ